MTACFMVEATDIARVYLRRYARQSGQGWACADGWHEAKAEIERGRVALRPWAHGDHRPVWTLDGYAAPDGSDVASKGDLWPHDDPRWPPACSAGCGYRFADGDEWQLFWDIVYRDAAGAEHLLRDRTPGMMWDAIWMGADWAGADGRSLCVVCPNGHQWLIDGPASNCTMQGESPRVHRCWIRHGTAPFLTVDKRAGIDGASAPTTCAAGAGSIQAGDFHGFLVAGVIA